MVEQPKRIRGGGAARAALATSFATSFATTLAGSRAGSLAVSLPASPRGSLRSALIGATMICAAQTGAATAGPADVIAARATQGANGLWRFDVTVRHSDTGWDHYADAWRIETPTGDVLGTRVLHHPHETEQPFTRSLSGVRIPPDMTEVVIRARDSVHGYGGRSVTLSLGE